jgi:hypothetical protein
MVPGREYDDHIPTQDTKYQIQLQVFSLQMQANSSPVLQYVLAPVVPASVAGAVVSVASLWFP